MQQSQHPAFTMAGLCAVGGVIGYSRTRSVSSIVAGLSVGAIYAIGGWRIQEGKDYGYEICAAASALLLASSAPRLRAGPVPAALTAGSSAALAYYGKKVRRNAAEMESVLDSAYAVFNAGVRFQIKVSFAIIKNLSIRSRAS